MHQRIKIYQGGYGGVHEEFVLERDSDHDHWHVTYQREGFDLFDIYGGWKSGVKHYDPDWLKLTIDELQILDLKTPEEMGLPDIRICDGLQFVIDIKDGHRTKEIYIDNHYDYVGKFVDVWRADAFWTLLKSLKEVGHGEEE
jgi:hypothetical protein